MTICRGVAVFLHRAIVMQAKVGSQSHSLTLAGYCRCKCGLIVLHGGIRGMKTKPKAGQGRNHGLFSYVSLFLLTFPLENEHIFFSIFSSYFLSLESDCCQTRHMTQRDVHSLYTHTHARAHILVMGCSTCTECWRSKRGGKVCSAAWAERLQGQMSILHMRPGGLLSLCCHCKSHKPPPCAVAVTSPTTHTPKPLPP